MSDKRYIAISVAAQAILAVGAFYSLAHQGRASQETDKHQTFLAVSSSNDLAKLNSLQGAGFVTWAKKNLNGKGIPAFARLREGKEARAEGNKTLSQTNTIERCSANPDSSYNRQQVLKQLAQRLNSTASFFHNAKYLKKKEMHLATVKDERPVGFSVHDLTDDSNTGTPLGQCIEFKDSHVYHFSLIFTPYSFSHVAILENGQLKTFKAINCNKGDRLEDLINYLNQKLKDSDEKAEIINRVRNYRRYGIYAATDDSSLRCEGVERTRDSNF
jgi:hypothetical protein